MFDAQAAAGAAAAGAGAGAVGGVLDSVKPGSPVLVGMDCLEKSRFNNRLFLQNNLLLLQVGGIGIFATTNDKVVFFHF